MRKCLHVAFFISGEEMFRGNSNPPVDEVLYRNYFYGVTDGVILECGAGSWGENSIFFNSELGWIVYLLEASLYEYNQLEKNRPDASKTWAGLSDKTGVMEFRDVVSAPRGGSGNGSFSHKPEHLEILDEYGCEYETYNVNTFTYKDYVEQNVFFPVDVFILDVEGHEVQALSTLAESDNKPQVVCVEYTVSGLDNIKKVLGEDYQFDFISQNNAFFSLVGEDFCREDDNNWFGVTKAWKEI